MTVGSLQNLMATQSTQAHAETVAVGDGATLVGWTDRTPATVVQVISPRHIVIREDRARYQWPEGQAVSIEPNPDGATHHVTRRKNGRWVVSRTNDWVVMVGVRSAYRDPSF